MGLDLVELVMDAEDQFGVRLDDRRLAQVRTVRDLAGAVASAMASNRAAACPTAARFFRLRSAWSSSSLVDRCCIRPRAKLKGLIPWTARKHAWRELQDAGLEPPRLRLSAWIKWPLCTACALGIATVTLGAFFSPSFITWAIVPIGVTLIAALLLTRWLPTGVNTVADLVRASSGAEPQPPLHADVLVARMIELTALSLGLHPDKVHADSRFIEDLGAG